jgi:threonine dehydrogenase-like Zn-dependent dehydrogenase
VLRNPTNQKVADCLGFNQAVDQSEVRDLVIVGAGPAGLAAAVYGASEGCFMSTRRAHRLQFTGNYDEDRYVLVALLKQDISRFG